MVATGGVAPSAREFHGTYYYGVGTNIVIVFGGYDYGYTYYNDTTVLSSGSLPIWTVVPPVNVPGARANFGGAVGDEVSQPKVMIYGGRGSNPAVYSDAWVLDLTQLAWQELTIDGPGPGPRFGMASGYFHQKPGLLIFGGEDDQGNIYNDLWWLPL